MEFFKYLRYFFYLAINWNVGIAWHIIKNEIKGEKKYGIDTTGVDELKSLEKKGIDISHATIYMPASYDLLEHFFKHLNISNCKHFLDIGCGKGRAMCVAASFRLRKITGVEFSTELYISAKENLKKIGVKYPDLVYEVYNNDAFYFEIENDVDCIFMFNPFDETIMSGVLENIEMSLEKNSRKITVVYINPLEKHLFLENGYKEIYHFKKLHYLEGSIFEKNISDLNS